MKRLQKCVYDEEEVRICPRCGSKGEPSAPYKRVSCICRVCGFECEQPTLCDKKVERFEETDEPRKRMYKSPFRLTKTAKERLREGKSM